VVNAILYQQTQFSYVFEAGVGQPLGVPNNTAATLQQDPRFTSISSPARSACGLRPSPNPSTPMSPAQGAGATPNGLANGDAFNEMIDPTFKTPYSIQFNWAGNTSSPGLHSQDRLGRAAGPSSHGPSRYQPAHRLP